MKTYAIGDIHGCLAELKTIVETLRSVEDLRSDDTLVFTGDYVDRGPDSKGVIDYLIELNEDQRCVFLMGNHEDMLLWWFGIEHSRRETPQHKKTQSADIWLRNGGVQTLNSYGIDPFDHQANQENGVTFPESHVEFLRGLPYYHIEGSNLFVHAGVSMRGLTAPTPEGAVELSSDDDLLWTRATYQLKNFFGTVVYGHTPSEEGIRWNLRDEGAPFSVGVDVGCVFGCNPLVAVRTEDWTEIKAR